VDSFAFIIHPINPKRDVARKYPLLGKLVSEPLINYLCAFFPPVYISKIEGITSTANGKQIKGWFIACPLTPARMLETPERTVYRKIIQTGRLAEELGAKILGLGAFTSVVGDGGLSVANALDIPVTTGDAYTVSIALQALSEAARRMEIPMQSARTAVVGATGAIGRVCAQFLADDVGALTLIGRRQPALDELRQTILADKPQAQLYTSTQVDKISDAQLIITVTSDLHDVIHPENLLPGCVICDVARPRDVSARVAQARPDVLVIDGGMVEVPGDVNFNFDFGFPPGKAYACMAETMALALDGRFEDYTIGKNITRQQVEEITEISNRHGFRLGGFRSFERQVTPQQFENVRQLAKGYL